MPDMRSPSLRVLIPPAEDRVFQAPGVLLDPKTNAPRGRPVGPTSLQLCVDKREGEQSSGDIPGLLQSVARSFPALRCNGRSTRVRLHRRSRMPNEKADLG